MKITSRELLKRLIIECTREELAVELNQFKNIIFSQKTIGSYPLNGETIVVVEIIYNLSRVEERDE